MGGRDRRAERRENNPNATNTNPNNNNETIRERPERNYDNNNTTNSSNPNRERNYDRDLRERRDDRFQRGETRDRRERTDSTGDERERDNNRDYRERRSNAADRERASWNDKDYRERTTNDNTGSNNNNNNTNNANGGNNNRYERFGSNNNHRGRYPSFSHDSAALHFDDTADSSEAQEEIPPSWDEFEPGCFSKSELLALFDSHVARPADLHDMDGLGIVIDDTLPPLSHVPLSAEEEQARANGSWLTKGFVPKVRTVRTSSISQANNAATGHPNSGGVSSTGTRADRAHSDQARERLPSWFDAPVSNVLENDDTSLATWSSQTTEEHQKQVHATQHEENNTAHANTTSNSTAHAQTAQTTANSTSSQWNVAQAQPANDALHANFAVGSQRNVSRLAAITGLDISDNSNNESNTSTSTAPTAVTDVDPAWRGSSQLDGSSVNNPSSASYGYNPSVVNPPSVQTLHPHPHPHPPMANPAPSAVPNQWYYKDPQGDTQGPFSDEEMRDWYQKGYFDLKLRIQCNIDFSRSDAHTVRFFPLGAWFFNGKKAFLDRVPDVVERAQAARLLQQQQAQHQAQLQAQQLQQQQLQQQHQRQQ